MRKIRLDLEALDVETFAASEAPGARGTVRAHSDAGCTFFGGWTCHGFGSCDPNLECLATRVDASCPAQTLCFC